MVSINLFSMRSPSLNFNIKNQGVHNQGSLNQIDTRDNHKIKHKEGDKKVSISDFNFNDLKAQLGEDKNNHALNIDRFIGSINKLGFASDGSLTKLSDIDINQVVNDIASNYVSIKHNIESSSDPNKEKLLNTLEDKFKEALNKFSDNLGKSSNNFFTELGSNQNISSKLENSIIDVVEKKIESFDKFLKSDLGSQFLKRVDDNVSIESFAKSLSANSDLIYKAQMEKIKDKKEKKDEDNNLFSLNDLKALGQIENKFNKVSKNDFESKTEEQLGFELSMLNISINDIMQDSEATEAFTKLVNDSFNSFTDKYLKDINQKLEDKSKAAQDNFNDSKSYSPLDLNKVKSTMHNILSQYAISNDKTKTIVDGLDMAKMSAQESAKNSSALRYKQGLDFFDNFYTPNKGNAYGVGRSSYQRYLHDM